MNHNNNIGDNINVGAGNNNARLEDGFYEMLEQADDSDDCDGDLEFHNQGGPLDRWASLPFHASGDVEVAEMVRYEYIMELVRKWERRANESLAQEKAARTVN